MPRLLVLVVLLAPFACKSSAERPTAAVLAQASGPVERGPNGAAFKPIAFGAKLYLGDHVRTGAGTAQIALNGGGTVALEPHTTIVLRAKSGRVQLEVGAGAAILDGQGTYPLLMGQVQLVDGKARITATNGRPSLQLVLGQGVLIEEGGQQRTLQLGQFVLLEMGTVTFVPPDAGVPDAAPPAATVTDEGLAIEITGDGAKVQTIGDKDWRKLAAGTARVPARSRVSLDALTTAKVSAPGAILTLAGGSRTSIGERFALSVERGNAVAAVDAGQTVDVAVPGGRVAPTTTATTGAETRIDVDARGDARVTALTGSATLTGKRAGAQPLELAEGTAGLVRVNGTAERGDTVIPAYFDHELVAGALPAVTIHDPIGATAVRFTFSGTCPATGAVEVDASPQFKTPRITAGKTAANLLLRGGAWNYRLRCGGIGPAVASGRIVVVRDPGTRPLPDDPPRFPIDADGRTYRVNYQSRIADVEIRAKGSGAAELHLEAGGKAQILKSATGTFLVPGTSLRETTYTFFVVQNGVTSKTSKLTIGFDQTAAQVYIEAPVDGKPWAAQVDVRGATLPGWTATIAGADLPSDKSSRRFHTTVAPPTPARAIAIQLAHPQRGVHIYLRRGAATSHP